MKILLKALLYTSLTMANSLLANNDSCQPSSVKVQVLGSGGPELTIDRASSSYLVWLNDKAIVMIDTGGGSSMRFAQSKARWTDLQALLFTHFHADHSSDLPALIKASWFGGRQRDLSIFGPFAQDFMPSTTGFLQSLFGEKKGAYQYLSDFYDNDDEVADYRLIPHDIENITGTQLIFQNDKMTISAQQVKHGSIPAFAYVINICGLTVVFSGDTNGDGFENLTLAKTDFFIAHNAIPESAGRIAKLLHMTPTQIGEIAKHLNTRKLILSHRMNRTLGKEELTKKLIQKTYKGDIFIANDLDIFELESD
ncbi:MAG: MBL fold metallo-hydrolase [Alcanivoracaceae bacterium]|nr:MBL fold metallo-hydrolase [Alcanivoracaceae bacterium]